jgi:hypothetical protein
MLFIWVVMSCQLKGKYRHFGEKYCNTIFRREVKTISSKRYHLTYDYTRRQKPRD